MHLHGDKIEYIVPDAIVSDADTLVSIRAHSGAALSDPWARPHRRKAERGVNALHATGQFPDRLFPPEARASGLHFVLQALDGSLGGASHREIARALLGQQRVHADWTDPRSHLRDRIRRAVRRGHMLMDRGYQDFLA
ncbi:DUF2285 domain-containing protein [Mesorhizobium sp. WSM3882]|uniref:DNA -binding domain-containing protein n=1 Tax=Mesorhizobium sp. WSM3882 TaxID=2029407 RepID=UPI000BAEF0CA|nr:DUF2285 domain-containing protein [Mesorhizobium sp. WSM3882]PBB29681.1 hypothetical protein CK214_24685 [Mesorhizobium sp. WSM3882]